MVESFSISTQKRSGRTLRYMVQCSLTYGTGRYLRGLAVDSYHLILQKRPMLKCSGLKYTLVIIWIVYR